jgi:hypothetical protein
LSEQKQEVTAEVRIEARAAMAGKERGNRAEEDRKQEGRRQQRQL